MFTKGTENAMVVLYKISQLLFATPFVWDNESRCLTLSSPLRILAFGTLCSYYIANLFHLIFNISLMFLGLMLVDTRQAFFNISYTLWYILAASIGFQIFYYRKETACFIKELFRLNEAYRTQYLPEVSGRIPGDHSEIIIRTSTMWMFSAAPCFGVLVFWYPDDYRYFYRFALPYTGDSWWVIALFGTWEIYVILTSWAVVLFGWFVFMLHCASCKFWIQQLTGLCYKNEKHHRTFITRRVSLLEHKTMFRQIQVLNSEYNRLNCWFFSIGMNISSIAGGAQAIYCFVLLYEVIVLFMYICFSCVFFFCAGIIVITFSMAGEVYESAMDYVRLAPLIGLKTGSDSLKLCISYAKSFYPIRISVGYFFKFRRTTPFVMVALLLNLAANAILMSLSS